MLLMQHPHVPPSAAASALMPDAEAWHPRHTAAPPALTHHKLPRSDGL